MRGRPDAARADGRPFCVSAIIERGESMTLRQALRILNQFYHRRTGIPINDLLKAVHLGMAALNHYQRNRNGFDDPQGYKLPGEIAEV